MSQRFRVLQELGEQFEQRTSSFPTSASVRQVRRWPVLGGAGAALTTAIVVVIALLSSGAPTALANWTAVPTPVSATALSAAVRKCYGVDSNSSVLGRRVLSEARGRSTAAIFVKDGTVYMCRYDSAVPAVTKNSMGLIRVAPGRDELSVPYRAGGGGGSSKLPRRLFEKLKQRPLSQATLLALRAFKAGDGYGYWVLGRAGSQVLSVSFFFADHPKVTATIENGWYFAWWPWTSDPTSVTLSASSGTATSKMKSASPEVGPSPACRLGSSGCVFVKTPLVSQRTPAPTKGALNAATYECAASSLISLVVPADAFTGTPVVAQVHGIYAATVHVADGKLYGCFVGGNEKGHSFYVQSIAAFGRVRATPAPGHLSVPYTELAGTGGGDLAEGHPHAPLTVAQFDAQLQHPSAGGYGPYAVGQAAKNITAITFAFANGKRTTATITNGWYLAWWPWISNPTSVTVTTSLGTVTSPISAGATPRNSVKPECQPGSSGCVFARP